METNADNQVKVCEARSYARCIEMGTRMAADHIQVLWKHTWPWVLLSLLLSDVGIVIYQGQLLRLLNEWRTLGYMPRRSARDGWREDMYHTARLMGDGLLMLLIIAIMLGAIWATQQWLPYGAWIALPLSILLSLAIVPSHMMSAEILFSGRPIAKCMDGWGKGYKHYGSLFAYTLLISILSMVLMLPALLPLIAIGYALLQAQEATLAGDTVMIPASTWIAILLILLIRTLFTIVTTTVQTFCLMFLWGSIQAREE